jgi:hypothetical protein
MSALVARYERKSQLRFEALAFCTIYGRAQNLTRIAEDGSFSRKLAIAGETTAFTLPQILDQD